MDWTGRLEHIHVADSGGAPMRALGEALAVAGRGIEGDRYCLATGTYSVKPGPDRQLTLIEAEVLAALARDHDIALAPHEHRRNLTVSGAPLGHLVGRRFRVGPVVLEAVRLNQPCKWLEKLTGKPVHAPLLNRSGLNCRVLEGGPLRPGDPVTPLRGSAP